MDIEKTYLELTNLLKSSKVLKNESMAKHTSFKIGGNADIFVKAHTIDDIKNVLEFSNNNSIPLYVMGNGSNILVKDNGIRGIVLTVDIDTFNVQKKDDKAIITVGAGVKLTKLAQDLLKEEISGFEFASRYTWHDWWSN